MEDEEFGSHALLQSPNDFLFEWHVAAFVDPHRVEDGGVDDFELSLDARFIAEHGSADCGAHRPGQIFQLFAGDDLDKETAILSRLNLNRNSMAERLGRGEQTIA